MVGFVFTKTSSNFVNRCFDFLRKLSVVKMLVNAPCYLTSIPLW